MMEIETLYNEAISYMTQSTCLYRGYCAIIIKDNGSRVFGVNKSPNTYINCKITNSCKRKEYQSKYCQETEFFEVCQVVHAEMEVLIKLNSNDSIIGAKLILLGIDNSTGNIYKSAFPCEICKKLIISRGFNEFYVFQTKNTLRKYKLKEYAVK